MGVLSFAPPDVSIEGFLWETGKEDSVCRTYLDQEVWTFDVEVVDLVKVVLGGVFEIFHRQNAGVGNEYVNLAKVLDGGVDHGLDTADAACICLDGNGAVAANLFNDLVGRG